VGENVRRLEGSADMTSDRVGVYEEGEEAKRLVKNPRGSRWCRGQWGIGGGRGFGRRACWRDRSEGEVLRRGQGAGELINNNKGER